MHQPSPPCFARSACASLRICRHRINRGKLRGNRRQAHLYGIQTCTNGCFASSFKGRKNLAGVVNLGHYKAFRIGSATPRLVHKVRKISLESIADKTKTQVNKNKVNLKTHSCNHQSHKVWLIRSKRTPTHSVFQHSPTIAPNSLACELVLERKRETSVHVCKPSLKRYLSHAASPRTPYSKIEK